MSPHPYDNKQLLICANDHGKVIVAETVLCPEGFIASATEKTCVKGNQSQPASPPTKSRGTRAVAAGTCKMSGPYCESCDRMVICSNLGNQGLGPIANISCSEIDPEMTCSKASCTTQAPPQSCDASDQAGAFRCLQPGFFPDPNSCKLFHYCDSSLSHYSGECDDQYNADLGKCTSTDPDNTPGTTEKPQSECKPLDNWCKGDKTTPAKLPPYPSYYVICIPVATKSKKATHFYQVSVAKCPGRQVFNDETQKCEITCTNRRGRFQDPDDCRSYIECSGGNPAVKKSCPEKFAFDADRRLCLPESLVQGCQRTRAVEINTTEATTTTQATTPSSLSTTTTGVTPSVGFRCPASGIFPDESNCNRYIICSLVSRSDGVSYRMRRRRCPWFFYFNPSRRLCQFGVCWD